MLLTWRMQAGNERKWADYLYIGARKGRGSIGSGEPVERPVRGEISNIHVPTTTYLLRTHRAYIILAASEQQVKSQVADAAATGKLPATAKA